MDPNQLHPETLSQNSQEPILPPTQTPNEIEETKKLSKRVLVILFLLLIILVPAGLFAYSKFKPTEYKSVSYQEPTPISSPKPTADPTANWETYESTSLSRNFSIKYPPILSVESVSDGVRLSYCEDPDPCRYSLKKNEANILIQESRDGRFAGDFSNNFQKLANELVDSNNDIGYEVVTVGGVESVSIPGDYTSIGIPLNEGIIWINAQSANPDIKKTFPALISSFKFIDQTSPLPSATPPGDQVACTQEAKLCPDGSYVSREGPNCEFSACP